NVIKKMVYVKIVSSLILNIIGARNVVGYVKIVIGVILNMIGANRVLLIIFNQISNIGQVEIMKLMNLFKKHN
ncbi:hypothetical protein GLOIN_2v1536233, partial [Rhizophagus irregularis DAOM 181602=DAOM 197198]